jgi:hypothetical protein
MITQRNEPIEFGTGCTPATNTHEKTCAPADVSSCNGRRAGSEKLIEKNSQWKNDEPIVHEMGVHERSINIREHKAR